MHNKENKALRAGEGLTSFFEQFGAPSPYNKVLLEVFLEELLSGTIVHLPSEAGPERNQDGGGHRQFDSGEPGVIS